MQHLTAIQSHLEDPDVLLACLDPTGGSVLPVPASLGLTTDRQIDTGHPLELFHPEIRARVVAAFAAAKGSGHATVDVPITTGELKHFNFYDDEEAGCVFVVMGPPTDASDKRTSSATQLPVRSARYRLDMTGNIIDIDENFERLLGWSRDDVIGTSSLDITHEDDHEKGILHWVDMLEEGAGSRQRMRQRFRTKDGRWLWLEDTSLNLLDDPDRGCVESELLDVSDEMAAWREAERREALLTRLTEALPSGVLHIDPDGSPTFWNQRWTELVANASPTVNGLVSRLEAGDRARAAIDAALADGVDADLDVTFAGATPRFGRLHLRPVERSDGCMELLLTLDDTTASRMHEQHLHDLSHRDAVTGVSNRNGLRKAVDDLLADSNDGALLFVDLDQFKPINDTYGHSTGDEVLGLVAEALTSIVRAGDVVARIGGDEFVIVVMQASHRRLDELVRDIERALVDRATEAGLPFGIAASIGVATTAPGDTFDSLLGRADQAMYEVKRQRAKQRSGQIKTWSNRP